MFRAGFTGLVALAVFLLSSVTYASSYRLIVIGGDSPRRFEPLVGEEVLGGSVTLTVPKIKMTRLEFKDEKELESARSALSKRPEIEHVYRDQIVRAHEVPNDPFWSLLWGHKFVRIDRVWDIQQGGSATKVAVIDSGIAPNHPDLQNFEPRWDYVDSDGAPWDGNGHGTHVTGIISATVSNGIGAAGIGRYCRPYIYRVLNNAGLGYDSDVAAAIVQASDDGCHVINLSLGSAFPSAATESACNLASANGSVIVAAAGNSATFAYDYPAAYPACIAVGSIDQTGLRSSFSNYGSWVDVAAPGSNILSTSVTNGYVYYNGTSMAAPYVAGIAALVYRVCVSDWRSSFYAKRVRGHIQQVARPTADGWCFFGTVDAYASVARAFRFGDGPGGQYATANRTRAMDVCVHPTDGTYFGAGVETQSDVSHRVYVTKFQNGNRVWTYSSNWSSSASANDVQVSRDGTVFLAGKIDGKFALWSISSTGSLLNLITLPNASGLPGSANSVQIAGNLAYSVGTQWITAGQRRIVAVIADKNSMVRNEIISSVEGEGIQLLWNETDKTVDVLARTWPQAQPRSINHMRLRASDLAVLNSQSFSNPAGADIDANMMVRSGDRLLVASQVSPADSGGHSGVTVFNRYQNSAPTYLNLVQGYVQNQLGSVVIASYGKEGFIFSCPKNNTLLSCNDCVVIRQDKLGVNSKAWPEDPLGPRGVRHLRGFGFGDARATGITVTPNGKVWVTGASYDDYAGQAVPTIWFLNQSGVEFGIGPGWSLEAGEVASAVLHPYGYLLSAIWIKTGYQPSIFSMHYSYW